ncbi:c-type cytochrome [Azospirillum sp. sgz301742]
MKRLLLALALLVAIGAAGFTALAWRPAADPIDPAKRPDFIPAQVTKGAQLALMGDCAVCHTKPDGKPYAGGAPLPTPFGIIYATNITPDPDTGIGRWSEDAFRRAMRDGVDREGDHLYPAFPYDHFTKLTDEDIGALYAFLMTREPVRQETPRNDLPFPLSFRPVLAGWKLLFLDKGPVQPAAGKDAEWNRGAYLAEALAHCGACHTPRNRLGAVERDKPFAGGSAEGWHAPALNAQAPAPVPWTPDRLFTYLRSGQEERHGAAAGPMAPVAHNLARAPEADVRAIAAYVGSFAGPATPDHMKKAEDRVASAGHPPDTASEGGAIYAAACATCHRGGQALASGGVPLAFSSAVTGPDPRNLIHIVLDGVHPTGSDAGPIMPGFATVLTDRQITALAAYLRGTFGNGPDWSDVEATARRIRQGKETS